MRRAILDHPTRPILVHVPTTLLDYLDGVARKAQMSRSEVIRQRLAPPPEVQPDVRAIEYGAESLQSNPHPSPLT
jgi:hypothetical protein